jgi:hypothetical protein
MVVDDELEICCICKNEIPAVRGWKHGHNADPVNQGRCCDVCNTTKVIPARIAQYESRTFDAITAKMGGKSTP